MWVHLNFEATCHGKPPDCWPGPGRLQGARRVFPEEKSNNPTKVDADTDMGVERCAAITERMSRWTGRGGRSSRSQTTLSHMSLNGLSASLKLIAETALWCVRPAPLDHLSHVRSGLRHPRQAAMFPTHPGRAEPRLLNR
jgi:hypothetical protein